MHSKIAEVDTTYFQQHQSLYKESIEYARLFRFVVCSIACQLFVGFYGAAHQQVELSVLSFALMLPWLSSFILLLRQQFRVLIMFMSICMLLQSSIMTIAFGTDAGIHLALWPLTCIFAMTVRTTMMNALYFAVSCLVAFVGLELFAPTTTRLVFVPYSEFWITIMLGGVMISAIVSIQASINKKRFALERLASRDNLTGLYNRRYFSDFLEYQCKVHQRERNTFCIAMGDIDHFKRLNDTYGHDAGDRALVKIANCFNTVLSKSDAVGRWGGEEFLLFIPEKDRQIGFLVTEAIRDVISDIIVEGEPLTISFGLVETDGNENLESVLKRADTLLYLAKSKGRNRVET